MQRCTRCVMPNTRPDTPFVAGVCAACLSYEKRPQIDWDARKKELIELLDRHDGKVIVPSSGGKDSTYQVITLLEMGADVTVVTATTCHLTKIGRANIDNLARFARTIEVSPNKTVRAKLNRLGLELVGDISWPEHISIHTVPFRIAVQFGIPLIFYGENPTNQYGGPISVQHQRRMTRRWAMEFGGFLGLRPHDLVGNHGLTLNDMHDYIGPDDEALERAGVEAHFLGQYVPWCSHNNANVAKEHGMLSRHPGQMNWWKDENQDNYQTGIHDLFSYLKYGFGRLTAQVSVDIRSGKIDREEAYSIVRNRDGLFPLEYLDFPIEEILNTINVSREKFLQISNTFTNFSLFNESKLEWGQKLTLKEFA